VGGRKRSKSLRAQKFVHTRRASHVQPTGGRRPREVVSRLSWGLTRSAAAAPSPGIKRSPGVVKEWRGNEGRTGDWYAVRLTPTTGHVEAFRGSRASSRDVRTGIRARAGYPRILPNNPVILDGGHSAGCQIQAFRRAEEGPWTAEEVKKLIRPNPDSPLDTQ